MSFFKKKEQGPIVSPEPLLKEDDDKKKSLKQEVEEIKQVLNSPELIEKWAKESKQFSKFMRKEKKFKIPSKVLNQVKREFKKNKVIIVLLKTNRTMDFIVGQIVNGMVFIGDTPHQASVDFVFSYKNLPVLVITEWNLSPIGTTDYYNAYEKGSTTEAATIIIRAIEAKEAMNAIKPKMSGKMLLWIAVGAIALIGVFMFLKK